MNADIDEESGEGSDGSDDNIKEKTLKSLRSQDDPDHFRYWLSEMLWQ